MEKNERTDHEEMKRGQLYDHCHLNGLTLFDQQIRFVHVMETLTLTYFCAYFNKRRRHEICRLYPI